jgi:hypothetical protein
MKTIFKYELELSDHTLSLPLGSKILSVANQHDEFVLYAEIAQECGFFEMHRIFVRTTGEKFMDDSGRFIGTVLSSGGDFVLHVYAT